jgi:hypothetical protein
MTARCPGRTAARPGRRCGSSGTVDDRAARPGLEELVEQYLAGPARDAAAEEAFFGDRSVELGAALARAGRSLQSDGTLHEHQRRIGHEIARSLPPALIARAAAISSSSTFHRLLEEVEIAVGRIRRVGELAVYDVAHRIGCHLGLSPARIYLHCGTRAGARALGLPWHARSLDPSVLPPVLKRLTPGQAEDFLCIFKDRLAGLS